MSANKTDSKEVHYGDSEYPEDYFGGVFILAVICAWTLMFAAEALVWRCQEYLANYNERESERLEREKRKKKVEKQIITKRVTSCLNRSPENSKTFFSKRNKVVVKDTGIVSDDLPMCQICIEPYKVGEKVSWSKTCACMHHFHYECIIPWLDLHDECPVCRSSYVSMEDNVVEDKYDKTELMFCATHGLGSKSLCTLSGKL